MTGSSNFNSLPQRHVFLILLNNNSKKIFPNTFSKYYHVGVAAASGKANSTQVTQLHTHTHPPTHSVQTQQDYALCRLEETGLEDLSGLLQISPNLAGFLQNSPDLSESLETSRDFSGSHLIPQDLSRSLGISPDFPRSLGISQDLE